MQLSLLSIDGNGFEDLQNDVYKADIILSAVKGETKQRQALPVRPFASAIEIKKPFFSLKCINQHTAILEDVMKSSV